MHHPFLHLAGILLGGLALSACTPCLPNAGHIPSGSYRFDPDMHTDGYVRDALLHLPPVGAQPMPLVVVIHGAFNTAAGIEADSGFSRLADEKGFAVLYPEGIGLFGLFQHWNGGHCCATAASAGIDDVGFVAHAIERTAARVPIDPARIYMVGHSNGGMLVHRFAAERGAGLAAAAVVAGTVGSNATGAPRRIAPARGPVPMLLIHGVDDRAVPAHPQAGGGRQGVHFDDLETSTTFWRLANGCQAMGCAAPVEVVTLAGWGHDWPSGAATNALPAGHPTRGYDAAKASWSFFDRQWRRPAK